MAVGRALGIRRHGPDDGDRMVYVLLGDGECNEGSVWEAFMAAGHYRLDNLVFIIDYNKVQAKGFVQPDMAIEPLRGQAGGLQPRALGGAERPQRRRTGRPVQHACTPSAAASRIAVILNTIKGKKVGDCRVQPQLAHQRAARHGQRPGVADGAVGAGRPRGSACRKTFAHALGEAIEIVPPLHGNPDQIVETGRRKGEAEMAQFTIPTRDETKEMRYQMGYALADLANETRTSWPWMPTCAPAPACTSSSISIPTSSSRSASPSRT